MDKITVVGGGLAGCEASWHLANLGYKVTLREMRPHNNTPAHVTDMLGELVCSNSLKSLNSDSGAGLLKYELRRYDSLMMTVADICRVPAGAALAVNRDQFAELVTQKISTHPNIDVVRGEVTSLEFSTPTILACGPLASDKIADAIFTHITQYSKGRLSFVDAISPVISADSIDMSKGFFAGRYGKGGDDYYNIPLTKEQFEIFYDALINADVVKLHDFEDEKVFERCMPIEVIASRGKETLLFGPMKPVGLELPNGFEPVGGIAHAVVQLRLENKDKTAYNIVGFQTKMTLPAQRAVLRLLPGLEQADFLRYGTIHRNTYIDAPKCIGKDQRLAGADNVYMAGQITGVEGYLESMASGISAAMQLNAQLKREPSITYHIDTAFGALQRHIAGEFGGKEYSPSNFHFGMLPPLGLKIRKKSDRKIEYYKRAVTVLEGE